MPKDRRVTSSFDQARVSPYGCSSRIFNQDKNGNSLLPFGNEGEWEDARCPICMEHPHNAVLLLCSSQEKGCHPYMCDTSYRHSNCLDQFRKSSPSSMNLDEDVQQQEEDIFVQGGGTRRRRGEQQHSSFRSIRALGGQLPDLACPLCRGKITGWVAVEAARKVMDSKQRSCALETCYFVGNYSELRKHARLEHPSARPTEADAERQSEWTRMERQRDVEDAFAYQSDYDYDMADFDDLPSWDVDEDGFYDHSFFDFSSELPEEEDGGPIDTLVELSFSLFGDFLSSLPDCDIIESGDINGNGRDDVSRRSNNEVRDPRSTHARLTYPRGDRQENSDTRLSYQRRDAPSRRNVPQRIEAPSRRPVPSNSSSRASYHRENAHGSRSALSNHRGSVSSRRMDEVGRPGRSFSLGRPFPPLRSSRRS